MFALGLLLWLYHRPTEGTIDFLKKKFASQARDPGRQHRARSKPAGHSARPPRSSRFSTRSSRPPMPAGTYRNITGNLALSYGLIAAAEQSGLPAVPGFVPDHPGLGHPARVEQAQALRRDDLPGRRRDRRNRRRPRRLLRRIPRSHDHVRPGHRAEVRDHRPGRFPGTAAAHHRRAARRTVHRLADQDRTVRPAAGDVRPQRRITGADRGARKALPTASTRPSKRPASPSPTAPRSSCSPTATSPTAPSPGRSPTPTNCPPSIRLSPPRPTTPATTAPRSSGPTCATRRPWPAPGRSPEPPDSNTASAAWRRPTARATSPTTPTTTTTWCACARRRSTASPRRSPISRWTTPMATPAS